MLGGLLLVDNGFRKAGIRMSMGSRWSQLEEGTIRRR